MPQAKGNSKARTVVAVVAVSMLLLVAAMVFTPHLDGPNSRQHANEAAAVGKLRQITKLQQDYAQQHSSRFQCELKKLRPAAVTKDEEWQYEVLTREAWAGYEFRISDCRPDANGLVTHYWFTAVPQELNVTGFRAFCTDESRKYFFATDGSIQSCISERRELN